MSKKLANFLRALVCAECGVEFTKRHDRVLDGNNFCNLSCRMSWHKKNVTDARKRPCEICGADFIPRKTQTDMGQGRYCSNKCATAWLSKQPRTDQWKRRISRSQKGKYVPSGPDNPNWKGGRYVEKDGYAHVRIAPNVYRQEHRVVMEQHLGRELTPEEIVHHINEDKQDNRIENLMIVTRAEHMVIHLHSVGSI